MFEQQDLGKAVSAAPRLASRDAGSLVFRLVAPLALSPNELACLRVVDKAAAKHFRGQHAVIHTAQPVPAWAFEQRWAVPGACSSLTRAQREKLVCSTAASNHVGNLKVALAAAGLIANQRHLWAAATAGALDSCKWIASNVDRIMWKGCWAEVLECAGKSGKQAMCEWCFEACRELAAPAAWRAAVKAASKGHADLASWLIEEGEQREEVSDAASDAEEYAEEDKASEEESEGPEQFAVEPPSDAYDESERQWDLSEAAMEGCDVETAIRLVEQHCYPSNMLAEHGKAAIQSNSSDWEDKLSWVLATGKSAPSEYWYGGIIESILPDSKKLERYAWLRQRGFQPCYCDLSGAVDGGDEGSVAWLLEEGGLQPDPYLGRAAAAAGHLRVLQMLARAGCRLDPAEVARGAASSGHLAVLEWALASLPGFAASLAAEGAALFTAGAGSGSVEAMRWLHAQGCEMAPEAWSAAVRSGCEAAVVLLAELGCPPPASAELYNSALQAKEWRMLPLLHRLGLPFGPELLIQAVRRGAPLASLEWLAGAVAERRMSVDWAEAKRAGTAAYSFRDVQEVIDWINEQWKDSRRGQKRSLW